MNKINIKKIYPALVIALPLLMVAAFTQANGSIFSTANAGYGGQDSSCPMYSAMSLDPMTKTVAPGEHIDFNGRNFGHEQDVMVYLDSTQVATAHADGGGNFTTGSLTTPTTPGTYTYRFIGVTCNTPIESTITVSNTGSNGSTGDNSGSTGDNGGTTMTATVTPVSATVTPGQHVDFNGRNFPHETDITVMLGSDTIGQAHADGGGNFSTGSLTTPTTPGTYTYTFVGGGTSVSSSVTVQ